MIQKIYNRNNLEDWQINAIEKAECFMSRVVDVNVTSCNKYSTECSFNCALNGEHYWTIVFNNIAETYKVNYRYEF